MRKLPAVAEVKILLPQLSVKELAEVIKLAELIRSKKGFNANRTEEELFYATLEEHLKARLGVKIAPLYKLVQTQELVYKLMIKNLDELDIWVDTHFKNITKSERKRTYSIAINSVCDYLEFLGVPLGTKPIINNLGKVPGLIDRAFPGYIQNGLLGMLLETSYSSWNDHQ